MEKKDLKPAGIFHYFEEICQVPRPSKKEEKIIAFLKAFGEKHKLETKVDEAGNVLIKKPATPGMENRKTVVLQSHVDMVCEKNNDVKHDFLTDPIETEIDGEWLKAKGTTLGADNGIGVATELAILADDSIEHGPVECLFTVDEETGLTGAFALQEGFMSGDILLNLDSEDEGELFIGCAGGIDSVAEFTYKEVDVPAGYFCCKVQVKGLKGGHSGGDIHLGLGNAEQIIEPLPEPDFQEVRYVSLRNRRRQPAQCHCTRSTCRYSHPRSRQACAAYRLECIRRPGGSRICCNRPRFAVYPRIGKSPCQSYRQRHFQTSVTGSLRSSTRSICHEPGYSGSCGNLHQSGIRKDETR